MTQQERRMKRENELKKAKEEIKRNHSGVCDHCGNNAVFATAHNAPRRKRNLFSKKGNLHEWCFDCHELYDRYHVYQFAQINMNSFLSLMSFLYENGETTRFWRYIDLFVEQSKNIND